MRYLVKEGQTVDNGKVHAAGDEIELTEEQAAAMPWAVEPAPVAHKGKAGRAFEPPKGDGDPDKK